MHLYRFGIAGDRGPGDRGALTPDERARAAAIRDPVRRQRFVARRAALHAILRDYSEVCFSASHSGDMAAVAVSPRRVGVDIEVESGRRPHDRIAARMFAPDEAGIVSGADGDARRRLFHRCWVAKEAYAKALGRGLGMRFDAFSVAPALRSPAGRGPVGREWTVALVSRGEVHLAVAAMGDWEVVEVPLG